jgi:signal transduction histidine kinase
MRPFPRSGLGLAIVRDVADLYGGSNSLEQGSMGGLAARLELPGAEWNSTDQAAESGV